MRKFFLKPILKKRFETVCKGSLNFMDESKEDLLIPFKSVFDEKYAIIMDPVGMDDQFLMKELLGGNSEAFKAIYLKYVDQLYAYGFNIIKDRDETVDTVQDLFMWLWESRAGLKIVNLKSYLFAALKFNLTRKTLSSRKREEILNSGVRIDEITEGNEWEVKELYNVIRDFIETLPPKAKEVFILSREKQLKHHEIAEKLGISENTVENHIALSLRKLRVYLSKISYWIFFLFFFH